jgi:hypothetical protein
VKALFSLGFVLLGVVLLAHAVRSRRDWQRYSEEPIEHRWWHLHERYLSHTSERDFAKEATIGEALAGLVAIALGLVGLIAEP